MQTINNAPNNYENTFLDFFATQPTEIRAIIDLYIAKFLHEFATDTNYKTEFQKMIKELNENEAVKPLVKQAEKSKKGKTFVAYTIKGKGLTQKKYQKRIMKASDEAHAGIGLIPHDEVFAKFDKLKQQYDSNLEKKSK